MNYHCGIIRDLIPMYIDEICGEESVHAVKEHIEKCEKCRKYYEIMRGKCDFDGVKSSNSEDMEMENGLKKIKIKINKKIRKIIIEAVSAVLVLTVAFQILFNAPIKKLDKDAVKISAEVYPIDELPHSLKTDNTSVEISFGENDESNVYRVEIPSMTDSRINVSEDVMERDGVVTVITTNSNYFLRSINWEIKDDTIYISSFKTTILNNKASSHQKTMTSLEFKEINKIVFVEKGTETILWSR